MRHPKRNNKKIDHERIYALDAEMMDYCTNSYQLYASAKYTLFQQAKPNLPTEGPLLF